jgi:hypothetical protein
LTHVAAPADVEQFYAMLRAKTQQKKKKKKLISTARIRGRCQERPHT